MTTLSYPWESVLRDYAGSLGGLALSIGPLIALDPPALPSVLLAVMAVVFAIYGGLTIDRHFSRVVVDDHAIGVRSIRSMNVSWNDLDDIRLRYYSTRRDGARGWMTIRLGQGRKHIRIESSLDRFETVLEHAARAVRANGLALDDVTARNFAATGYPDIGADR